MIDPEAVKDRIYRDYKVAEQAVKKEAAKAKKIINDEIEKAKKTLNKAYDILKKGLPYSAHFLILKTTSAILLKFLNRSRTTMTSCPSLHRRH